MTSVVTFQHWITFEPLNQISKTKLFWNLPTCGMEFLIFHYLIILCKSFITPLKLTIFKIFFVACTPVQICRNIICQKNWRYELRRLFVLVFARLNSFHTKASSFPQQSALLDYFAANRLENIPSAPRKASEAAYSLYSLCAPK